jgi:hypothetical protein
MLKNSILRAMMLTLLVSAGAEAKDDSTKPAKIKSDAKRGFYSAPFEVKISSDVKDAKIYYTTNGSVPSPASGILLPEKLFIESTTVLRSAGYRNGKLVTEVDTHTFVFPSNVLVQTGAGFPKTWGQNNNQPVPADYEMDPEIVNNPTYHDALVEGLKELQTLSVVLAPEDLFGAADGLYTHPLESGEEWERTASVELIHADGTKGFQVDCGIRIQGGWNRRPEESPKHAFRFAFRKKYGAGKLKYQLFPEKGADEFDQLILRAGCNNSWLHWSGEERRHGDYIRDQWMRDSHAAMGHPAARGVFVHLYLNGLYWGVYNLTERPNENFAARHFGGNASDYDCRNSDRILQGDDVAWKRLFALANAGLKGEREFAAVQELLDLPAFIDFIILNLYAANEDWDHASNWYAARRRNPADPFHFFVWDGERTLENFEANTLAFDDDQSPVRLFQKLRENPEFRMQFGDRVQRHLFGDGALTPRHAADRFHTWSSRLENPIVAESARWGAYRRDVHPYKVGPYLLYTRDEHWRPEIRRITEQFFPHRTEVVLRQFRRENLYPKIDPPSGEVKDGKIEFTATSASIYYSIDGNDPRAPAGQLSPSARKYDGPVSRTGSVSVKARALAGDPGTGEWSTLIEF